MLKADQGLKEFAVSADAIREICCLNGRTDPLSAHQSNFDGTFVVQHNCQKCRLFAYARDGFTTFEIAVCLAIVTIFATIAIPTYVNLRQRFTENAVKATAQTYAHAIEQFSQDHANRRPNFLTPVPPGCGVNIVCDWKDSNLTGLVDASRGPHDLDQKPYLQGIPELVTDKRVHMEAQSGANTTASPPYIPNPSWWSINSKMVGHIQYVAHPASVAGDRTHWTLFVSARSNTTLCWIGSDPNTLSIAGWSGVDAC